MSKFSYPSVKRDSTKELIHGIEVNDPYRWLEDPDSEDTKRFVDSQNAVSMPYIESCVYRNQIKERLTQLWNYRRYGCPFRKGDNYFYHMNTGLQNQSVIYIMDSLESEPTVFFDPNLLSEDGTTSLKVTNFSEDGQWFAYGLNDSGSDWFRIRIRNVTTGEDCPEELIKAKFTSMYWTHDNKGFFYACHPDRKEKIDGTDTTLDTNHKLFYHRINTPQSEDVLVVQFKDHPFWRFGRVVVSDCGKYLHVMTRESCHNTLWHYVSLDGVNIDSEFKLIPIIEDFSAEYKYISNDGDICYVRTNKNAPNFRLVKVDLKSAAVEKWVDLIPEHQKDVLDWCSVGNNDVLIACYLRDVTNIIELRKLSDGSLIRQLDIPIGSITGFKGGRKQKEIFYYFTSFLTPGIIYHYDFVSEPKVFKEISVQDFDPTLYVTKQVFYESKDGTKVPMFVVHQKDIEFNGENVCLLYGYGGFSISIQPSFSNQRILLMKNLNGIFALANIRGGGEYGQKWHDSGRLLNKQNSFDDFHAAAQYLIDNRYTNRSKLIIEGRSNGGLLVRATANQRPDLYGCVICHVGVIDMLRFHKFTIGQTLCSEFGNPDDENHFNYLLKYSPLHNIPNCCDGFPATLLLTADHDDRAVPLHSLKFIAELQNKLGELNPNTPFMIRVDTKAGHGHDKPTAKSIEEFTDIYSFIINSLGLKYND